MDVGVDGTSEVYLGRVGEDSGVLRGGDEVADYFAARRDFEGTSCGGDGGGYGGCTVEAYCATQARPFEKT